MDTLSRTRNAEHLWGIILAGGEGKRLQQFIRSNLGHQRPKQYCTFTGGRSLLRRTIDRVGQVVPRERILTSVLRQHLSYAISDLFGQLPESIAIQPFNRDTGPGILLPLLFAYHRDPEAIVALVPSDHFIIEENRFIQSMRDASLFVIEHPGHLVLVATEPVYSEPSYSLVEKGEPIVVTRGQEFIEARTIQSKPTIEMLRLLEKGVCLWNTSVLVARAVVLLNCYRALMPDVFRPFQMIANALGSSREEDVIEDVYLQIPPVSFARSILERCGHQIAVLPVKGMYWSDWDEPHRVQADLAKFGSRLTLQAGADVYGMPQYGQMIQYR